MNVIKSLSNLYQENFRRNSAPSFCNWSDTEDQTSLHHGSCSNHLSPKHRRKVNSTSTTSSEEADSCDLKWKVKLIRSVSLQLGSNPMSPIHMKQVDPADPYSPWFIANKRPTCHLDTIPDTNELDWRVLQTHGNKRCIGYRKMLRIEQVTANTSAGMTPRRRNPNVWSPDDITTDVPIFAEEFTWLTFFQARTVIMYYMKGLIAMGVKSDDKVLMFMEFRHESYLISVAAKRTGAILCFLPHHVTDTDFIDIISELKCTHIITSRKQLSFILKAKGIRESCIQVVIVATDEVGGTVESLPNIPMMDERRIITLKELEMMGKKGKQDPPNLLVHSDKTLFIVYTCGTTSRPRGVQWSYHNFTTTIIMMSSYILSFRDLLPEDPIALLTPCPLLFEVLYGALFISNGIGVAFSHPSSLMPANLRTKSKSSFDLELVHPDILIGVPMTLTRLRSLLEAAPLNRIKSLFAGIKNHRKFSCLHNITLDLDTLKTRLFGGKLKVIFTGGGTISRETSYVLKQILHLEHIICHYGCAETLGGLLSDVFTSELGTYPLYGTKFRLLDWEEGGYKPTDKPHPRGEIALGGDIVSTGYFSDVETDTFWEEGGTRWAKTGDIGEIMPDGSVRLIDRKKNLFRNLNGTYVCPGYIEEELRGCPLVDNAFVTGDPSVDYIIALVVPNRHLIFEMSKLLGKTESLPFLCYDEEILKCCSEQINSHCLNVGLKEWEIPRFIRLCSHPWTPESGLVTSDHLIRRQELKKFYQNDIRMLLSNSLSFEMYCSPSS